MKKYIVELTDSERSHCQSIVSKGRAKAKVIRHANILLCTDVSPQGGKMKDEEIHRALGVSIRTVQRVRESFVEQGFEVSLQGPPVTGKRLEKRLDGEVEAHLIALACSDPPEGYAKWSLRLLADRMVELHYVDKISHESVRQVLKKMNLNHGERNVG